MMEKIEDRKKCWMCKEDKPVKDFPKNKRKRDGLGTECKLCANKRAKEWYNRPGNASRHKTKLIKRRADNKQKLIDHYGNKCADCEQSFVEDVYDFHHLDPTQKEYGFGKINTCSWEKIEREIIGKCVMLCSNCHRIRHATGNL